MTITRIPIIAAFVVLGLAACSSATNASFGSSDSAAGFTLASDDYRLVTSFQAARAGYAPLAGPIIVDGRLYGSTLDGGHRWGTIYRLTLGGRRTILWRFAKANGIEPKGALLYLNGLLYGTTYAGGVYNGGTVFSLTLGGAQQVIHSFGSGKDGQAPSSSLVLLNGALYGTTTGGGQFNPGSVFRISPDGSEEVIHSFSGGADGGYPTARLTAANGVLYGGTLNGGSTGGGVVFEMSPSGKENVLYSVPACPQGYASGIMGNVAVNKDMVYAASYCGGRNNAGAIYAIATTGRVTDIYDFKGQLDGRGPSSSLTLHGSALYGMTDYGGTFGSGTVYAVTLSGSERTLHSLRSGAASQQRGSLLYYRGRLYGTEMLGGSYGKGALFSVKP